ncbi:hypothetical protein OESDEN_13901 [Oesophagostomum dentatum]|uniref:Uncharacterized protein n=1 Tax=Oesophagostomum dentatum TaxID=61180 RepID=A0A0B1SLZ9_OESDE|nr:hypothetical protein OESDEN_13901 [Oesophagostomum dentatum]
MGDIFSKKFEFDEKEQIIADVFRQSIVEFVKNGTPLNRHQNWPDIGKELRYLRISPELEVKPGFFNESASFWYRIREHGFDMAQLLPTKEASKSSKEEL